VALFQLTHAARLDLRHIHRQGEELFGLNQADAYGQGLVAAFRTIKDFPLAAPLRDVGGLPVRARAYKSHVVLYVADQAKVLILRIRHAQEDWINDPVGQPDETQP